MAGVNKVILVGNLGRDPEVRSLENGAKVARFSVATTESYRDKTSGDRVDTTEWHNVVLWRGLAEIAEKFLKKGSQVYIEGKLQTRQYEDKDKIVRYSTEIIGQTMTMLGGRGGDASSSNSDSGNSYSSAPSGGDFNSFAADDSSNDLPF